MSNSIYKLNSNTGITRTFINSSQHSSLGNTFANFSGFNRQANTTEESTLYWTTFSSTKINLVSSTREVYQSPALSTDKSSLNSLQTFLFALNETNIDFSKLEPDSVLKLLSTYEKDLTGCLLNCSNNGICALNTNYQLVCVCNQFYSGSACSMDSRPCSSNPCQNNGNCTHNVETSMSAYVCSCPPLFYGRNCQFVKEVCRNVTCSMRGVCVINESRPQCKCFSDFSGESCQITSRAFVEKTQVSQAAMYLSIAIIFFIFGLAILIDLIKLPKYQKN